MKIGSYLLAAAAAVVALLAGGGGATPEPMEAMAAENPASVIEVEDFVYLLNPPGRPDNDNIVVAWIPGRAVKHCTGKTLQQCVDLEYCFRVAQKHNAEPVKCKAVHDLVATMPAYPAGITPRRVVSCMFFPGARNAIKGMDALFAFRQSKPREYFDRISPRLRFRARMKLTRVPDDYDREDFEVVEVLGTPGQ